MAPHDVIIGLIIALPIAFFAGRYSTRIAFFHTRTEEKLTVSEFLHARD
jgi:hypothetical protein